MNHGRLPSRKAPLTGIKRPLNASVRTEWMHAGSWTLPSGKALAEFALQAGFLAPLLLRSDQFAQPLFLGSSRARKVN